MNWEHMLGIFIGTILGNIIYRWASDKILERKSQLNDKPRKSGD